MRLRGRIAAAIGAALLLTACKQAPPQPAPAPALWEVAGANGEHGYLFGTIHSLPQGYKWRTKALDTAFAGSDELLVEVDLAAKGGDIAGIFARLSRTPGLPPLSQRLASPAREALVKAMAAKGLTDADFANVEDWAAAITISQAYEENAGGDGVDLALLKSAAGKRVVELEGAERQLRVFDALPEADQRDLLAAVAKEALEGEQAGDKRLDHWLRGNVDALTAETHEGMLADPHLREALLTGRNRDWAAKIAGELGPHHTLFVAVGAAHTVGPEGLAALLQQRGYKVTRIQ